MKKVIICVDAGGTSTKIAVIDQNKEILIKNIIGPGSPAVNINACEDIYNALTKLYNEIKDSYLISAIILGMSGFALVDTTNYKKQLEDRFKTNIILISDVDLAYYSTIKDEYNFGCVVVSGTGAAVQAVNDNKSFMSNGWGQLLTERGSGYTCVRDYVCLMIHTLEEKGHLSPLGNKFLEYCGFKDILDFKPLFYRHSKDEVASYSKFFIEEACRNHNKEAIKWLETNGTLIGKDIVSSCKRVKMPKDFPIGFRGGFINGITPNYQIESAIKYVKGKGYNPILVLEEDPLIGGYYYAKKNNLFGGPHE